MVHKNLHFPRREYVLVQVLRDWNRGGGGESAKKSRKATGGGGRGEGGGVVKSRFFEPRNT